MLSRRDLHRIEPHRAQPLEHLEERRTAAPGIVAHGTLACPACDAPVLPAGPVLPREPLSCPVCRHDGAVRDFLSLATPSRAAHVVLRVRASR